MSDDKPPQRHRGRWIPGTSGNPRGNPPGSGRLRQMRELLEPRRAELVEKVIELALSGDVAALRICMDRLAPPARAESDPVEIPELAQASTMAERALAVVSAIGEGQVSPTAGLELLNAIAALARAIEVDELAGRVKALEERTTR